MKYDIHDTKAMVIRSHGHGEHGLSVLLMTREFGCLYARAVGARKPHSKIRSGLVDGSYVSAGLVAGKCGWRVTYLVPHSNFYFSLKNRPSGRKAVANILSVCGHLIGESEGGREVFEIVKEGLFKISSGEGKIGDIERSVMLRLLYVLGYVDHSIYSSFFSEEGVLRKVEAPDRSLKGRRLTREINRALSVAW